MTTVSLSATPRDNAYQATVAFPGVSVSSAETYTSVGEAIAAAARKLLEMSERLERLQSTSEM